MISTFVSPTLPPESSQNDIAEEQIKLSLISNAIVASHTHGTWSKHLTLCRCAPAFCFILLYSLLYSTCLKHTGLLSARWFFSNLLWFQWFCIHCFFCLELLPQIFTSLPPSHHLAFNSNVSASGFLSQLSYRKQLLFTICHFTLFNQVQSTWHYLFNGFLIYVLPYCPSTIM